MHTAHICDSGGSPYRGLYGLRPPLPETPGQRPLWTETHLDRAPPPLDRDPIGQRPSDRDHLLWTETPTLDRGPLWKETSQKEYGIRYRNLPERTHDQAARQEVTEYRGSCEQNDSQTGLESLPCPKLHLQLSLYWISPSKCMRAFEVMKFYNAVQFYSFARATCNVSNKPEIFQSACCCMD